MKNLKTRIKEWFSKPTPECDQDCTLDKILLKAKNVDVENEILEAMRKYRLKLMFLVDELDKKIKEQEERLEKVISAVNSIKIDGGNDVRTTTWPPQLSEKEQYYLNKYSQE